MQNRDQLYVDGRWTAAAGASTIAVVSPSTEEIIGRVPEGTPADVDAAAAAARAAFDPATPSLYGNREWAMCCTEGPVFPAGALDWARIE